MSAAAPTPYSTIAAQALVIGLTGAVANFFAPEAPIALAVNAFSLWRMFTIAKRYATDAVSGFDSAVAAEAIVGFGVASLVLGLASVIALLITGRIDLTGVSPEQADGLLAFVPFVEGLLTAGLAPFFAILLRLNVAEIVEAANAVDETTGLARAMATLTRNLSNASKAIEVFESGAAAAGVSTTGLASTMEAGAGRWSLALQAGEVKVGSFANAARGTASDVAGLAAETERLKTAMGDAATLLDELGRLVQSVERFVSPPTAA